MVWNVTKEEITVRMAYVNEEVWPPPATEKPLRFGLGSCPQQVDHSAGSLEGNVAGP
jgi:hypothetical protein